MNNIFNFQIFLSKQFHNVFMLVFGTKISKIILISKFILAFCMHEDLQTSPADPHAYIVVI